MKLLTASEVGELLKLSKWQVYELAKLVTRDGDERKNPLPCVRIGAAVRFARKDVEAWLDSL